MEVLFLAVLLQRIQSLSRQIERLLCGFDSKRFALQLKCGDEPSRDQTFRRRMRQLGRLQILLGDKDLVLDRISFLFVGALEVLRDIRLGHGHITFADDLVGQRSFVSCGNEVWWFDSAAEVVEWVEACHVAACFALLEAAGFERGPWREWHKDGCLIQPHARFGEPRFDIYARRRPSDWGPLQPPDMKRGDWILYRTFTNLDLQTLLEFRGWPTAEQVEADEESDRLAALLSPETLDKIDAVLAEVDAGILPDDGVPADVSLQKVRRAAEG